MKLAHADVTVTDKRTHAPVENLTAADFRVLDSGKEQPISHFSLVEKDDRPLALVLMVEVWSPSRKLLADLPESVSRMFARLRPEDRVAVIGYGFLNERCHISLRPEDSTPFTHDPAPVLAILNRFADRSDQLRSQCPERMKQMSKAEKEADAAALMKLEDDATHAAMTKFGEEPDARPELIAFADDLNIVHKSITVPTREALLCKDLSVNVLERPSFWIGSVKFLASAPNARYQSAVLEYYAHETGGIVLSPAADKFNQSLEDLLFNIRAEYSLAWKVPPADAPFHTVRVEVRSHKGAQVHARQGYFTAPDKSKDAPAASTHTPPPQP